MRWLILLVCFFMSACSNPAVLYTDEMFRAASPEVIDAWKALTPLRDARVTDLPAGAGLRQLKTSLEQGRVSSVLVGVALSQAEQNSLLTSFPKSTFLFLADSKAENSVGVRRAEAWAVVGRAAASEGPAAVFFPPDATPDEIQGFQTAWTEGGGGPLATSTSYNSSLLTSGITQVFQWGGPDWDTLVQSLSSKIPVHGNPGMARAPGTSGLTWRIRENGLGEFLWNAATESGKHQHFLPLETVLEHR